MEVNQYEEEQHGCRKPKKVQDPMMPSPDEVEEHNLTHIPFRSWCKHCIRGRGESVAHSRAQRDPSGVPELHMDYCFLGCKDEETQPIMVMRDRDSKMMVSFLVREKGASDPQVIRRALAFLAEIGHVGNKIILKSDQESPIRAVAEKIASERTEGQTILEHSPVGSSASNGIIERGIKEFEYQLRTMKSALDQRIESEVKGDSKILPWLIEYSSVLLNRFLVGKDGKTAYERLKGKSSNMLGFEFGESVHFRRIPLPGRLAKLESLWMEGIMVGYKANTGEFMVANSEGVSKTRNLRRRPVEERWVKEPVESLKFMPWKVRDQGPAAAAALRDQQHQPRVEIEVDKSLGEDIPLPSRAEPVPRKVYLTKAILNKYGMTDGCVGCTNAAIGGTGIAHSEECRKRIEKAMQEDHEDREKLKESRKRQMEFANKHWGPSMAKQIRLDVEEQNEHKGSTVQGGGGSPGVSESSSSSPSSSSPSPGVQPGQGMEVDEEKQRVKRKRDPGDEGDDSRHDEDRVIMEVMCEDPEQVIEEKEVEQDIENYRDASLEEYPPRSERPSWADQTLEPEEQEVVYDDLTGKVLEYAEVIKARLNEIEALKKMGVWEVVPLSQCISRTSRRPIKGRWVDINKGDDIEKNYRSRYVARELRQAHGGAHREGLFAAMPPLEALKIMISRTVTLRPDGNKSPKKLLFLDISKAYLHAPVLDKNLYVDLPVEMGMPGSCGHLKMALYGTREAAKCWEQEYSRTLRDLGFIKGRSSPCLFRHRVHDCTVFIHGDDFVVSGEHDVLLWVQEEISRKYLTKVRGLLGPDGSDDKDIIILNRVLEWRDDGISLEADPRHVELILQELNMKDCKSSDVMGPRVEEEQDEELEGWEASAFRSLAARCNFLSTDRVDIQYASKEICRRMSKPCRSDWKLIKKLARYLKGHPRMTNKFMYQQPYKHVTVRVDTDYAGCKATRRSTNGGMIMLGSHMVKSWATTQTVVALSSGEAEYYGVAKGACEGLGVVGLLEDLTGSRSVIELETDSSAAKGIAMRKGVGKVKHLETRTLWVQDQVIRGRLTLRKIHGDTNTSDILTKYLGSERIRSLMSRLPVRFEAGRSTLAPRLQGDSSVSLVQCGRSRRAEAKGGCGEKTPYTVQN